MERACEYRTRHADAVLIEKRSSRVGSNPMAFCAFSQASNYLTDCEFGDVSFQSTSQSGPYIKKTLIGFQSVNSFIDVLPTAKRLFQRLNRYFSK